MTSHELQHTIDRPAVRERVSRHGLVAVLFAAALLAFALPFGTVSCGTPVTFTGYELATASVSGDDPELAADINASDGPVVAIGVLVAVVVGLLLALAGAGGQGWVAGVGLVGLSLLPWLAVAALADTVEGRSGFWLAFGSLATVTGVRASAVLGRRRRQRRRIWPLVVVLCLFGLLVGLGALMALPETA